MIFTFHALFLYVVINIITYNGLFEFFENPLKEVDQNVGKFTFNCLEDGGGKKANCSSLIGYFKEGGEDKRLGRRSLQRRREKKRVV